MSAITQILGSVDINIWILLIAVIGVFIGGVMLNWVNKTVGLKFAFMLFQMKKKKNKDKILLKIFLPNGKPDWKMVKLSSKMEYQYKENGKDKTGIVMYDYLAVIEYFSNIKVLEVRTNDIFPRNPYVDTSLNLPGELVKKNIVDSSKEDFSGENVKKWIKIGLPLLLVFGGILILYSQGQADALNQCSAQLAQLAQNIPREAIIATQ